METYVEPAAKQAATSDTVSEGSELRRPTKKIDLLNLRRRDCITANTAQCAVDAIKVVFLRIQACGFAKNSSDTRTYLVCRHPTITTRKHPDYGEAEKVFRDNEASSEEGRECR